MRYFEIRTLPAELQEVAKASLRRRGGLPETPRVPANYSERLWCGHSAEGVEYDRRYCHHDGDRHDGSCLRWCGECGMRDGGRRG